MCDLRRRKFISLQTLHAQGIERKEMLPNLQPSTTSVEAYCLKSVCVNLIIFDLVELDFVWHHPRPISLYIAVPISRLFVAQDSHICNPSRDGFFVQSEHRPAS